jgi:N-acetylneuraminic acid mutarotase
VSFIIFSGLTVLDGFVYAIGGWEGSSRLDSVERFDPQTNSWEMLASMKIAVTSPAVVAHLGKLYVTGIFVAISTTCNYTQLCVLGGAVLEDGDGIELVQRYDPQTNTWEDLQPMLIPRSGSAACILNGSIYVLGKWKCSFHLIYVLLRFLNKHQHY